MSRTRGGPEVVCLDCHQLRRHAGRGLCDTCYKHRSYAGTLHERPTTAARGPGLADSPTQDGLTYRQVDYWIRVGYLHPDVAHPGSGSWRSWPDDERAVAQLMVRLKRAGLTVADAHRAARAGGNIELGPGVHLHLVEDADPGDDGGGDRCCHRAVHGGEPS